MLTSVIINLAVLPEWEESRCPRECLSSEHDGVVVRGVAAWLGSCFGGSIDTVLQNDIWGRDLSLNASQSHQVLQSAQINGAESWLCRAVHHVCLTACCSPCLSMIHPPISYRSREKSRNLRCRLQQDRLPWFTSRLKQYDVVEQFVIYLWIKCRFGETSPRSCSHL